MLEIHAPLIIMLIWLGLGLSDGRQINVWSGQCGWANALVQLLAEAHVVQTILGTHHVRCGRGLRVLGVGRPQPQALLNGGQHFAFEHENQEHQQTLQNVESVGDVPKRSRWPKKGGQDLEWPRNAHHDEEFHISDVSECKITT